MENSDMRTLDPNQLQEQLVWTTRAITELFYAEITEAKLMTGVIQVRHFLTR